MEYISVRNWGRFQHYKDRNPPWIKLHTSLLDDYEFQHLPDAAKWQLLLLWALAARKDNRIPHDRVWIASTLGVFDPDTGQVQVERLEIDLLIEGGWLEIRVATKQDAVPGPGRDRSGVNWASRYVSDQDRKDLLERAAHKCQECGSGEKLEVDHIVPISGGGDGEIENLQILCRSCNRKKRSRSAPAEQDATQLAQPKGSVSTTAVQLQAETESDPRARAKAPTTPEFVEQF